MTMEAPSLEARVAAIEQALAERIGLNVHDFDPQAAVAARKAALDHAAVQAKALLSNAVDSAFSELSVEDRLARLEQGLIAATGRSV